MPRGTPFRTGNKGKPKGAKNKVARTVKETVLGVFNRLQNHPKANMDQWAEDNPTEFYRIASKLIPTEVTGTLKKIITVTVDGDSD